MRVWHIFLALGLMALSGCAAQGTRVVLLEDADGSVGRIEVKSAAGSQSLQTARQETQVKDPEASPTPPRTLAPEEITRQYGEALAALPQPPETFRLYFEADTTVLTTKSTADLQSILSAIQRRKSVDVRISGHTDRVGSEAYNLRLSLERAEAIRDHLVEAGVDLATIRLYSHGFSLPLVPTADQVPEPRNRRVEVIVR
jgi:outer membrane protein OmpA-like peptidoglycan-associated protein